MKIVFGALTGTKNRAAVATMVPPIRLEGQVIKENMQQITEEIHKTRLVRLIGIRVRNNDLKKKKPGTPKMIKAVIGLVNQATKRMFGFTYKLSERARSDGQQYCTWEQTPAHLNDCSVIDVARRSMLCTDIETPGHPRVPIPMEE